MEKLGFRKIMVIIAQVLVRWVLYGALMFAGHYVIARSGAAKAV